MDYIITDDISKATHYLAYPDETSIVKDFIIPGKAYELIDHDYILSEDGCLTTYWMCHKGDFIIQKEN